MYPSFQRPKPNLELEIVSNIIIDAYGETKIEYTIVPGGWFNSTRTKFSCPPIGVRSDVICGMMRKGVVPDYTTWRSFDVRKVHFRNIRKYAYLTLYNLLYEASLSCSKTLVEILGDLGKVTVLTSVMFKNVGGNIGGSWESNRILNKFLFHSK